MELILTNEPKALAGERLAETIVSANGQPLLLLLSGGSWFEALNLVEVNIFGRHITIGMCDERFSEDSSINNFAQLTKTNFYKKALETGVNFIDTRVQEGETLAELARRFENALGVWKKENPSGVIIAALGMGADGHTAGLFTGHESFVQDSNSWVVGYEVSPEINQFTKRVTITPSFLVNEVDEAVVLVSGAEKCPNLSRVLNSSAVSEDIPAVLWQKMKFVTIATDCVTQ